MLFLGSLGSRGKEGLELRHRKPVFVMSNCGCVLSDSTKEENMKDVSKSLQEEGEGKTQSP